MASRKSKKNRRRLTSRQRLIWYVYRKQLNFYDEHADIFRNFPDPNDSWNALPRKSKWVFAQLAILIVVRKSIEQGQPKPVRSFALDLLLPPQIALDTQAGLDDMWPAWRSAHGVRKARLIRLMQIGRIVVGHHALPVLNYVERLLKIVSGFVSIK